MSTQCLGKSSLNSDRELALKDGLDGAHPPFVCHYLPSLHASCRWPFSGAQTGQTLTTPGPPCQLLPQPGAYLPVTCPAVPFKYHLLSDHPNERNSPVTYHDTSF